MGTLINVDYNHKITMEEAERYIPNFEKCHKYFNEEAILFALNSENARFGNFVTTKFIPINDGGKKYYEKHYLKIAEHVSSYVTEYTFIHGEQWERTVSKICDEFLIENSSLDSPKLYSIMLNYDYPFLKDYITNVYRFNATEHEDEFYVSMKNKDEKLCLYVPYMALKEKNPQGIIDRTNSYWKSYYDSPDRKEYLNKQLAILNWESTKEFFEHVRTGK